MSKKNFFSKSISVKLISMFLAVSIVPIIILGLLSSKIARNALEEGAFSQLESIGTLKSEQIISFIDRKFRDLEILAASDNTIVAFEKLKKYHDTGGATPDDLFITESVRYQEIYNEIDAFFRKYVEAYNFNDIFFLCADHGHIMYTASKESDLGANLSTGSLQNSGLAELWADVVKLKKPVMIDYAYYAPSDDNASFIGTPIFDASSKLIGIIALQLSTDKIRDIMHEDTGLGVSGETYIVGSDYLMRSDSRFDAESTILKTLVKTKSVDLGLEDKTGTHIIEDYRGTSVLSYYKNIGLNEAYETDFEWVVIAEINESEALSAVKKLSINTFIIGIIIALIVGIIAVVFSRLFTSPIKKLTLFSKLLADGDLSRKIDIKQHDEIGTLADAFSLMQSNLRIQMEDLTEGVNVLSTSSSEIMATVSQLASGAAETATSVSETTSTVEEVKQTAEVSNQKATEVAESAQKISMISQEGTRSIQETIDGMSRIKQQMESIAGIVIQLSEKSHSIGEIANTVGDLAEQSNLLAVNASIEAAKAGEEGKGFSVVAQEIKNLADRSKESTRQIRTIVSDIQKATSSAVMATEQGKKAIDEGLDLTSTASEVITTLAASVEQASQANIQIASSSQQQLIGMDQITSAMENIRDASAQTASSTKQSEESVVELNSLGDRLQEILKKYKLK